jgi:hypothetical protein
MGGGARGLLLQSKMHSLSKQPLLQSDWRVGLAAGKPVMLCAVGTESKAKKCAGERKLYVLVTGHRLRIVQSMWAIEFGSHANHCDRLAIIPVQCRERSCTARPRAGDRSKTAGDARGAYGAERSTYGGG